MWHDRDLDDYPEPVEHDVEDLIERDRERERFNWILNGCQPDEMPDWLEDELEELMSDDDAS